MLTLVTLSRRFQALFGPLSRIIIACLCITFVFARAAIGPVLLARPPVDELTWVDRSLMPAWLPIFDTSDGIVTPVELYHDQYYYTIHHPTIVRLVYRFVLHANGFYNAPNRTYDYGLDYEQNLDRGNYLSSSMRTPLRLTNAVFVWAALILLYFALCRISRCPLLAAAALLPIICEPSLVSALNSVVGYIGTDAALLFMLALFWLAWLYVSNAGFPGVVLLGILGGLAASTKYNGAVVLVAAMLYCLVTSRGCQRLLRPLVMGAIAVAVFVALNPIYTAGNLRWAWTVFSDTVGILSKMQGAAAAGGDYISSPVDLAFALFPYIPFALPVLAVLVDVRRRWWFGPTFLWSFAIIAGNLAVIMVFLPTYAAPVRIAFTALLAAAGLAKVRELSASPPTARPAQSPAAGPTAQTFPDPPVETLPAAAPRRRTIGFAIVFFMVLLLALASVFLGELPTPAVAAALVIVLAVGCWMILQSAFAAALVLVPLVFVLPWHGNAALYDMTAFSLAATLVWLASLVLAPRPLRRRAVSIVAVCSAAACAVSRCSLVLIVLSALLCCLRLRPPVRRRALLAFLLPCALVICVQWVFKAKVPPLLDCFPLLPSRVWNLPAFSEAFHAQRYNHAVFKFGRLFFWAPAAVFAVFAFPFRRTWWFLATFGGAALLFVGTFLYGGTVYFQWSLPLQLAVLVPSGIVAVLTLRAVRADKKSADPA